MVITDEPSTRKASQLLDASIAISALSLGTLSPKKTTFIIIDNENIVSNSHLIYLSKNPLDTNVIILKNNNLVRNKQGQSTR